ELRRCVGHADRVRCVALSPDGRHALSGGCDMTLRLWDVDSGRQVQEFPKHHHWVLGAAFAPDGHHVLSASLDGTVRLWHMRGGWEVGGPGRLGRLWGWLTRREVCHFDEHRQPVTCVAFLPDGRYALSGSMDRTLRLWDAEAKKEVRQYRGHTAGVTGVAV